MQALQGRRCYVTATLVQGRWLRISAEKCNVTAIYKWNACLIAAAGIQHFHISNILFNFTRILLCHVIVLVLLAWRAPSSEAYPPRCVCLDVLEAAPSATNEATPAESCETCEAYPPREVCADVLEAAPSATHEATLPQTPSPAANHRFECS